jgi:hypothetical protein
MLLCSVLLHHLSMRLGVPPLLRLSAPGQSPVNMVRGHEPCKFHCKEIRSIITTFTDPHTRYYVLIAACVVARKTKWIRNACLAAVLLFPAIAALHGIVLAALHVEGKQIGFPILN